MSFDPEKVTTQLNRLNINASSAVQDWANLRRGSVAGLDLPPDLLAELLQRVNEHAQEAKQAAIEALEELNGEDVLAALNDG